MKEKTTRRASVKPKVAEMVVVPEIVLNVTDSVDAFLEYVDLLAEVTENQDATDVTKVGHYVRKMMEWLTTYGGTTREQVGGLRFSKLISVFQQAGGAFTGVAIPQQKSVP